MAAAMNDLYGLLRIEGARGDGGVGAELILLNPLFGDAESERLAAEVVPQVY